MRASIRAVVAYALLACLPGAAHAQGTPPAACASFSDDSLPTGTPIKTSHVTQLRACIDAWRVKAGLPSFAWTDLTLTPAATAIRAIHVAQLREALATVYVAYGRPAPVYSDPSLVPGVTEVRRAQVAELRAYARFNVPPVITGPPNQTSEDQSTVSVAISASGAAGRALSYGAAGLPPGLAVNSATGVISGTINAGVGGTYSVTVSASDGFSIATRSFTWRITVTRPPSISGPSRETMFEGASVSVSVSARDPDGRAVTFAAAGLPPGLSINPTTGIIAGTLATGAFGHFFPVVTASNGPARATLAIPWTVIGAVDSYVYDSFTGTDYTDLHSHTPDKHGDFGNQWWYGAGGPGHPSLQGGTIGLTTDSGMSIWQLYGGSYDVIVAADISSTAPAPYGGLALRVVDSNNYFVLTMPGPSLYRVVQGQWTVLAQPPTPQTVAAGREYRLEARLIAGQIQVFWNGALLYYANDSTNQDATHHGLFFDTSKDATFRLDNLEMSAPNHGPTLVAPDEQLDIEGASVALQLAGTDDEATALAYSASGLPAGVSINPATGAITGAPAHGSAGVYAVGVSASDGQATATRGFTWRVLAPSATLIFDTFNSVHAEQLANHRFTIGPPALGWHWLRGLYFPTTVDGAVHTELSPQTEAWTANVGLADVMLAVDVHSTDATPYGGLILRGSNSSNYLFLRYDGPYLYRYVNGDYQEIGEAHVAFIPGDTHRLAVRAIGDRIDVYSDGVLLFSKTETFNKTATRHGLLWNPTEDARLTFDNFELRSDQAMTLIPVEPPACDFAVSPLAMSVSNEKNTYGVDVSAAAPGCALSVHADSDAFLEEGPVYVTSTGFRVTFSIQNNTDPHPRIGYFVVGGHTVTITQAGGSGCSYSSVPSAPILSFAAQSAHLSISANCGWAAASQSSFIHVIGSIVQGNGGTVSYAVDANPNATSREGTIAIGGTSVVVTQLGIGQTSREPEDSDISYYHADAIGSVRLITDASGHERARYDYLPSGVEFNAPPFRDPRTFAGKEHDAETGFGPAWGALDYFGARYYQGQTGRFTSVDPLLDLETSAVDPQQWNRYVYARNNPLKYNDPDGRSATLVGALVGGAIGGGFALAQGGSWRQVTAAAAGGAISGAMLGSVVDTGGASLGVLLSTGALSGLEGRVLEDAINARRTSLLDGTQAAVAGMAGVAGGEILGAVAGKTAGASIGSPRFISTPDGQLFPVPAGATGPFSTRASGMQYTDGSGGPGLDSRVSGVRVMDANGNQGARVVYMNSKGQTVNPQTGRTVSPKSPDAHLYFEKDPQ